MPDYIAHIREDDNEIQTVTEHLIGTAKLSQEFSSKAGLGRLGYIMGLGHDFCKFTQLFLDYITGCKEEMDSDSGVDFSLRGKIDHSSGGAQFIYRHLHESDSIAAQVSALAMMSHHGGLRDCVSPDGIDIFSKRLKKPDEDTRLQEALQACDPVLLEQLVARLADPLLVQECRTTFFKLREREDSKDTLLFKLGLLARFLLSCLIDADRLDTAAFMNPREAAIRRAAETPGWQALANKLEAKLSSFPDSLINQLRKSIADRCRDAASQPKGIFKLCVPTGGGKTLASLRFALHHAKIHGLEHIIYVTPFTSIIEQNAEVVRELFADLPGGDHTVLEHHSDLSLDERTVKQRLLSENWNAPIIFTTMVQFLNALFDGGTKSPRRMHALANSVVIFDEIQALPVKCVEMFNTAIRFLVKCCGTSVVLCTATQPLLDRISIQSRAMPKNAFPIIPDPAKLHILLHRTKLFSHIRPKGWMPGEVRDLIQQELTSGNSVLAVVNTKASAHELYDACAGLPAKVYHLSTDMCPQHRLDTLHKIRDNLAARPQVPTVCVSTALIEAGVDIDFGTVIRYLAGLDSVVQAAGRCNRNGERDIGKVYLINAAKESLKMLPEIRTGQECTHHVLYDYEDDPSRLDNDLLSPRALEQYYTYYFFNRSAEMCYPVKATSPIGYASDLFNLLSTNSIASKEYKSRHGNVLAPLTQAFQSANRLFYVIDQHTRGVIVPYREGKALITELCSIHDLTFAGKLLVQAQRYTVNVYAHTLSALQDAGALHEVQKDSGVYYLDESYYDPCFGLCKQGHPMETQLN